MLKIITTFALSLLLLFPTMAQENCVTPEMALEAITEAEPDTKVYELDRKVYDGLGVVVFYAAPSRSTLLAVSFDTEGCFTGDLQEITKDQYRSLTGKVFVDAQST